MNSLIQKVIVPVDFSPASEAAARFGCALARNLGAHVFLVQVIQAAFARGKHLADASESHQQPYLEAQTNMTFLFNRLNPGGHATTEIRRGAVHEEIASAVDAYGADLVVMATHGRTGIPHLLLGSVAERVIRTANCPVLVMRDSGQIRMHRATSAARNTAKAALTA